MRIKYEDPAKLDLLTIGDYYRRVGGNSLASRMVKQIRSEIGELANFPELAPLYELAPGVRRLVVADGNYLVFYAVVEMVEILHVRRGERTPAMVEDMAWLKF